MMQFRIYRFSCLASVAWAALMAPQAWAADEVFADAADAGIVVNGSPIRESMEASLEIQRESDNIVNAITADTAGRFPDQTVAGALSRLPGIGVQRDQGQERYVQVRGAPTRWIGRASCRERVCQYV